MRINHPIHNNWRMPYLNTVAYACYHMGVNENNFAQRLPEISQKLRENGDTIDHLDSNVHNNCEWNLSVMSAYSNSSKKDYAARLKPPYFLYGAVTKSGEYRILIGWDTVYRRQFYYICSDEQTLRHFLRSAMEISEAPPFAWSTEIPKTIYEQDKKAPYAAKEIGLLAVKAERILSMDESQFTRWNGAKTIAGLKIGTVTPFPGSVETAS